MLPARTHILVHLTIKIYFIFYIFSFIAMFHVCGSSLTLYHHIFIPEVIPIQKCLMKMLWLSAVKAVNHFLLYFWSCSKVRWYAKRVLRAKTEEKDNTGGLRAYWQLLGSRLLSCTVTACYWHNCTHTDKLSVVKTQKAIPVPFSVQSNYCMWYGTLMSQFVRAHWILNNSCL